MSWDLIQEAFDEAAERGDTYTVQLFSAALAGYSARAQPVYKDGKYWTVVENEEGDIEHIELKGERLQQLLLERVSGMGTDYVRVRGQWQDHDT